MLGTPSKNIANERGKCSQYILYSGTRGENKSWDNGRNHNPPQNSPIKTTTMAIPIATTIIMLINTKGSILVPSSL